MSRHAGVALESVFGTPIAPTDFFEVTKETLSREDTFEDIVVIRQNSPSNVVRLNSMVSGDLELQGNYQDLGLLLHLFYGAHTTSGTYDHAFPGSAGTAGRAGVSGTVEVRRDTDALTFRYAGTKVVGYQFEGSKDASPKVTFSAKAKSEAKGTAASPSFPTFDPMLVGDLSASFDGGSTPLVASTVRVGATWDVDSPFAIGGANWALEPIDNTWLDVTGEFTVLVEDATEYDEYDGSTDVDIQLKCTNGTEAIEHNINAGRIISAPLNVDGKNRVEVPFAFRGIYDAATSENMEIVLTNDDPTIPS